jgi:ABC-type transport system substrate-binding protein
MDVLDANHLKISYSSWEALTISYLASNVAGRMVSPTTAKKYIAEGKEKELMLYPVGTGPFKLVEFKSNVSMKLTRWEDYWQKGLPYLDNIEISIVADPVVALTSFMKGEAHVIGGPSTKDAKDLKSKGYKIEQYTANIFGICGDSKNAGSSWANMDIRKAVAYAINRDTIVNDIYDGMFPVAQQMALPGRTAYDSSIQGYTYNIAKAKALLEPLGITPAKPLTTKFVYELNAQRTDLYTAIQSDLAKVGINIVLSPLDAASYNKFYTAPWTDAWVDYNMSYNGLSLKYMTSLTWSLSEKQNRCVSVWEPEEYNVLFRKLLTETDPNKLEGYYQALNKMAVDTYCLVVPVSSLQSLFAYSTNAKDIGLGVREAIEFLPERFWLSK